MKNLKRNISLGRFMLRPDMLRTMADNLETRTGSPADKDILISLYKVDVGNGIKTIGVMPVEELNAVIKTKKQAKKAIKKVAEEKVVDEVETAEAIEVTRLKDLRKRKKRRHIAKIYSDLQKKQAKKKVKQNG